MLLNCHTYYSFCYGTLSPEQLFDETEQKGYDSLVISDINNTSAVLDALRLTSGDTPQRKLKVIPGIDFRNGINQQYTGIAQNNEGYKELNEHLSQHLHTGTDFETRAPQFNNAYVVYPFRSYKGWPLMENEFIGISAKELPNFPFSPAKHYAHKLVVFQSVTFSHKKHFNAHRLLRAIDKNVLLSMLPQNEQTSADEIVPEKEKLYSLFSSYPQAIKNTENILSQCHVEFKFGKLEHKNLKHYTDSVNGDLQLLKRLAYEGLKSRYTGTPGKVVIDRLEKELEVIGKMNFASYFLLNWDIITYARHKNYYYVGRGSGANSLVAYLLKITGVDPIELDLYFERFINEFRTNAPDFDIDFSWTDRDDVTRYIFDTFGKDKQGKETKRVALLSTYSTFKHDSVRRELGKVFGLPAHEIDKLQNISNINDADQIGQLVINYSTLIQGFPRHLSIHSSGILISQEPITAYSATFMPPKGYPTTQFSMLEAEDIGLFKFDILSQRGLGKIKDALELVKENQDIEIDIHDIKKFTSDEEVKKILRVGKCIGCFYVESPAMRMLLAKLQADDYLRLVAASSIIRPGVSKSGMMREYILRYRNENKRDQARAALPELYELLKETYGVMVYQEDVIKIAHIFAGLTLAEADYLRRGMSWKFKQRNEFHKVKEKFFNNCYGKGYPYDTINNIWVQIESFANFAFSKGHSASYAVESFQALYLKAHYPLEYMVATLNNGGGFYRTELYVHEARMHGANIFPPCINNSDDLSRIKGKDIYLGLAMIGELEKTSIEQLMDERQLHGLYKDLYDFVKRVKLSVEQIRLLIKVGAFAFTGKNKKELMWEVHMLVNPLKQTREHTELFDVKPQEYKLPKLEDSWIDDAFDEIELLGFALCSPFDLLKVNPKDDLLAKDLRSFIGKTIEIEAYLVTAKNTSTSKGERMYFGTFLDKEGYWVDTVHFPPSARAYPLIGPGCYRLIGRVVEEFDFIYIEVEYSYRLTTLNKDDVNENTFPVRQTRSKNRSGLK
ncbi:MAG: DNA polymerase III subunit alpha [Bacteroidetes bacterium]|nr:DNA polymerase III subunit alpha [Bacteroidota bacterium]